MSKWKSPSEYGVHGGPRIIACQWWMSLSSGCAKTTGMGCDETSLSSSIRREVEADAIEFFLDASRLEGGVEERWTERAVSDEDGAAARAPALSRCVGRRSVLARRKKEDEQQQKR